MENFTKEELYNLLVKYINHVGEEEGVTFTSHLSNEPKNFTEKEIKLLQSI